MANEYKWGINPIQDVLLQALMLGGDISNADYKENMYKIFSYILENYLKSQGDIVYLDFNIVNIDEYYILIGNNILTALWVSGVFPENSDKVMECNQYIVGEWKFSYNVDNKTLKYELINE